MDDVQATVPPVRAARLIDLCTRKMSVDLIELSQQADTLESEEAQLVRGWVMRVCDALLTISARMK